MPYAHWITPEGMPKRFDTWFFLAAAPPEQAGAHDGKESTDSIWVSPREALAGGESGRFKLPFPTTRNLIRLGKQGSVQAALDDSRGKKVVTVMPVMTMLNGGRQLRIPAEAGYDGEVFEVGAVGLSSCFPEKMNWLLFPSLRGAKRRSNPTCFAKAGLLRFARNDDYHSSICSEVYLLLAV